MLKHEIEIPEGVKAELEDHTLTLIKDSIKLSKKFSKAIEISKENNKIVLKVDRETRRDKKLIMTYKAHINNLLKGLEGKFRYELKICNVHFPMNVSVDKNEKVLIVKNFLGERKQRKAKILEGVEVSVKGEDIIVEGNDIEKTGQTAANFEKATKVTNRDRRIYQDGIFMTKTPRKII